MPMPITYTFSPGAIIFASQFNQNFTDVKTWADAHEIATTGVHGVSTGTIVGTTLTQVLTNKTLTSPVINGGTLNNVNIASGSWNAPGITSNLGLSLSGGTLTILGSDGTNLSATSPAFVSCPSSTAGRVARLKCIANATINDDVNVSSNLTGVTFGITSGRDWAQDMPFALYAVNRNDTDITAADGTSKFAISRQWALRKTPSGASSIGDTGAGGAPSSPNQEDNMIILGDVTVANYVNLPLQLIGFVRMRWASGTTDWTIQALASPTDGIGQTFIDNTFKRKWTMAAGQNGANASIYMSSAGTLPAFSASITEYYIFPNGKVRCYYRFTGDAGTDGSGGNNILIYVPYTPEQTLPSSNNSPIGFAYVANPTVSITCWVYHSSGYALKLTRLATATTQTDILCSDFTNGSRQIEFTAEFMTQVAANAL